MDSERRHRSVHDAHLRADVLHARSHMHKRPNRLRVSCWPLGRPLRAEYDFILSFQVQARLVDMYMYVQVCWRFQLIPVTVRTAADTEHATSLRRKLCSLTRSATTSAIVLTSSASSSTASTSAAATSATWDATAS